MKKPSKLGFGLMRLPMAGAALDMEQICTMVDRFLDAGYTYFDTAWGYHGGLSEVVVHDALTTRHPRDSFLLADKLPLWVMKEKSDLRSTFGTQLARTGAGHFDYYLMHAVNRRYFARIERLGIWDFMKQLKAEGLVHRIGFSFHDSADVLRQALDNYPETEFVQLQINYADWASPNVQSKLCYDLCVERNIPVIVMEPVKGGSLAVLPEAAKAPLTALNPNDSMAKWAFRYCATLPGVLTTLSGMSTTDQLEDNINTFNDIKPLSVNEQAALAQTLEILESAPTIGCTGCQYCLEKCPQSIAIPSVFDAYNDGITYALNDKVRARYAMACGAHKPETCIACGACEAICPQHLDIIPWLKTVVNYFA